MSNARVPKAATAASVNSMTGFARAEGSLEDHAWVWEAKSVNSRGIDIRCRVPTGYDELDAKARLSIQNRFTRGAFALNLTVNRGEAGAQLTINRDLLEQVMALGADLQGRVDPAPPRLEGLLAIRGIVEPAAEDDDDQARTARIKGIEGTLAETLAGLEAMRAEEGARMAAVVEEHLDEIARLTAQAESVAVLQPDALRDRLREQVQALLEAEQALSEERLAQEAAVLATKADVREEIDRLKAHIEAARDLLGAGGAIGRKLDFLCQEFNRESNTICSKSQDIELTRIGLAFKAVIDQFREQVQNIE